MATLAEKLNLKKDQETVSVKMQEEKVTGWLKTQGFNPHTYSQPRPEKHKGRLWMVVDINIPSRGYATFISVASDEVGKYRCAIPTLQNDTETLEVHPYNTEEEFVEGLAKLLGIDERQDT